MLQLKIISAVKRYQTVYEFKRAHLKTKKPWTPNLIAWGNQRKTIKVIKALRVKHVPVTSIAKGIVMSHNNRFIYLLFIITLFKVGVQI